MARRKAYTTPQNKSVITHSAASKWLTLAEDWQVSARASRIMQCYGYLIRKDRRWLHRLPVTLQAEIEILIRLGGNNGLEKQNKTVAPGRRLQHRAAVRTMPTAPATISPAIPAPM